MAEEIPIAYDKTTGGTPVGLKEVAPGNQLANQWLAMPPGYIDGMIIEWVSGSSIRVTAGVCTIPGGGTLTYGAALTKAGVSLGANTWGHIYAYLNGSTPDVEIVTASPSAPYSGRARTKAGDATRRYLGSIRTNASGSIYRFDARNGQVIYMEEVVRPLSGGTSATATTVSLAALLPPTSFVSIASMNNTGTAAVRYRPTGAGWSATNTGRMYGLLAGTTVVGPLPTDTVQQIDYQADSGGIATLDVLGYILER
ncbi:hypothetical protein [Xanthomonas campestris]|uniref:hypothetical protein n=1 Tax=Xanthomonas campestris TaxID=339 RepID=UPI0023675A3E|nr:hypothetical protein [Xanthomonas campestris]WDI91912.1 hypothetical protein JH280_11240 [Xanthomonas campestris]